MSDSKHTNLICIIITIAMVVFLVVLLVFKGTSTASETTEDDSELSEQIVIFMNENWQDTGTEINLSENSSYSSNDDIVLAKAGTYILSGELEAGHQILVNADAADIHIVLNGVTIEDGEASPIEIKSADAVLITLADGTTNTISATLAEDSETTLAKAAIFSKADLYFNGTGSLTINSEADAIQSKEDLVFIDGTYNITTGDGASEESMSQGEGMQGGGGFGMGGGKNPQRSETPSMPSGDSSTGSDSEQPSMPSGEAPSMPDGNSSGDSDGNKPSMPGNSDGNRPDMKGGNQSDESESESQETNSSDDSVSLKGLKAADKLWIIDGTFTISTEDDAVHSDADVIIDSGTLTIKSSDDGIHGDSSVTINNGEITIALSYEGIEGTNITVNDGTIDVTASDDGFNASNGDGSMGFGLSGSNDDTLTINGGTIHVDADGDGLDSNGDEIINGGTIYVDGPTNSGNGALDSGSESGGVLLINKGTIVALGASGMAETFSSESEQTSISSSFDQTFEAGDTLTITDSAGNIIFEYEIQKSGNHVVFSSAELVDGETYEITVSDETKEVTAGAEEEHKMR